MEGVPLTRQDKTFETRTDLVERENRIMKKNFSPTRHFSIQYLFKAKLAKTKEESLKFRYDKREERKGKRRYKHDKKILNFYFF